MGILKIIDAFLEVGQCLDWATPLVSLTTTAREDRLVVDGNQINEVEGRLRDAGIKIKRRQMIHGKFVFDVDTGRGDEAARILEY